MARHAFVAAPRLEAEQVEVGRRRGGAEAWPSARDGLELAGGHGRGRAGQVLDEMPIRMES